MRLLRPRKSPARRQGIEYEEINLDDDPHFRQKLLELTGGWTVPQILIDGKPIGGYAELWRMDKLGILDDSAASSSQPPA